jgi:ankyrin repeat protein
MIVRQYTRTILIIVLSAAIISLLGGCVSQGLYVSFQPGAGMESRQFASRDKPASITKRSPSELLLEGYVQIGVVGVAREEGEADINAHVFKEAARRGGDLVILIKDNHKRSETRYRVGECIESKSQARTVVTPQYETRCDYKGQNCYTRQTISKHETVYETVCVKWQQIPYTVSLTETVAKVFRHDPEFKQKMAGKILIVAISSGHPEEAAELIQSGAPVTDRGKNGETPLSEAAGKGYNDLIKTLLSKGADVNEPGTGGATPLAMAAGSGHLETVKLLLSKGASTGGEAGGSALLAALSEGHTSIASYLAGRGIRLDGAEAARILRSMAREGKAETVELLLNSGVQADGKNPVNGYTALMAAAEQNHKDIVKLLLKKGADVNAKNIDNGLTPLFYAVQNGHVRIVKLLIAYKANVNAQIGQYGNTVLQAASGNEEIIQLLRNAGAKR